MAALTGSAPKNTYKDLLQISNSNAGINGTLGSVSDGEDTASLLQLSTTAVNMNGSTAMQISGIVATDGPVFKHEVGGMEVDVSAITTGGIVLGSTSGAMKLVAGVFDGATSTAQLKHEHGGLELDVSAFAGLVQIDSGTTAAITVTAAGKALIDDAAASNQRTTLGLGTLATKNTVGAAEIDAGAVGTSEIATNGVAQSELKTTSGEVSTTSVTTTNEVMPGGAFGFYPRVKNSGGASGNLAHVVHETPTISNSFVTIIGISENGSATFTVQQTYVQASPPYDLGDGEVATFAFLAVSSGGNMLTAYVAEDPPWAYNGPTNIVPDFTDKQTGKMFQIRPKGFVTRISKNTLLNNPVLREQFFDARRSIDPKNPSTFDTREITLGFKNSDMSLIPHHMHGGIEQYAGEPDWTGATVVLLDPVSPLMEEFRILSEETQGDITIAELINDGFIEFGNSAIPGRAGPPGVMVVDVNWKP